MTGLLEGIFVDEGHPGVVALYEPTQLVVRLRDHLIQHLYPQRTLTQVYTRQNKITTRNKE